MYKMQNRGKKLVSREASLENSASVIVRLFLLVSGVAMQ